jgi:opacity protein-like surface antigen
MRAASTLVGAAAVVILASGVFSAAATQAAYDDHARLNTTASGSFELGLLDAEGRAMLPDKDRLRFTFPDTTLFVPGSTAELGVNLFNNSRASGALLGASVETDAAGAGTNPAQLRFSAAAIIGERKTTLFGDPAHPEAGVPAASIPDSAVRLNPRQADPLRPGQPWAGTDDSRTKLVLYVHFPDTPGKGKQDSAAHRLTLILHGQSISPQSQGTP